jgi:hypothetical protein
VFQLNFEESLVYELSSITGLDNKIFPLGAKEGTSTPFVVYISSEGNETQTLNGYIDDKLINCEIYIVASSYAEMKNYTKLILAKLKTFYGRQIGVDGVYIKSFSYDEVTEAHEEELGFERSTFEFTVRI